MDKKILLIGALGLGAVLLLSKKGAASGAMFTLPDGRQVPESQLPSLGYVQYQGQWYHQSQFQAPPGTDTSSPQWLNYLNTALQTGQQLFVLGGSLSSTFLKTIKSTAVDWTYISANGPSVDVSIQFGYLSYSGKLYTNTSTVKTYSDQKIEITATGTITKIKLIKAGVVQKEAEINFATQKLTGFDAGSVGVSGIYIGGVGSIGAIKKQVPSSVMKSINEFNNLLNETMARHGGFLPDLESDFGTTVDHVIFDIKPIVVKNQFVYLDYSTANAWKQGKTKERYNVNDEFQLDDFKYHLKYLKRALKKASSIGAIYDYEHPKALTHCGYGAYSDAAKGACAMYGGAHEIKIGKNGLRSTDGRGKWVHYKGYRKEYKNAWARNKRKSDKVTTL